MALSGDFIGFTFNGVHSSEMGIIRTSNGSRFDENLLPTFSDKTVQVPGGDGTYYFGSNYTQRTFPIQIATDELTEIQFRKLKQWLGDKQIHPLVFDDTPYKQYMVKVNGTPTLKFICFDKQEGDITSRVYKGEGTIQFISYYPYARCVHKYLNNETYKDLENIDEWKEASGLKEEQGSYDGTGEKILLYNAGDLETDFLAYYSISDIGNLTKITLYQNNVPLNTLTFNFTSSYTGDEYIRINSKTNLIEGCDKDYNLTGTVYNSFITSGVFFKLPLEESEFKSTGTDCKKIEYDYLYY